VPPVCNIHVMTLLVSQVFIVLLEFKLQYSCSAVTYQMAPTCSKQMGWVQSLVQDWTTGLDYWTHPNCKLHNAQCRIEAKHRFLFTQFANTAS